MIAVITSVLAGASAGLLVAVIAGHSLAGALAAGGTVASVALAAMTRHQRQALAQLEQTFESLG